METFILGIAASFVAGLLLWLATHRAELSFFLVARRRRGQLEGTWHAYHVSRDAMRGKGSMWVEHISELSVSPFGGVRGRSRAQYGKGMRYRVSGYVRAAALRLYLDNVDAHEGRASFLYPNLLGGDVLVGILVGEDFDRQWFASPSIMSREPVSESRLGELAKQLRVNRTPHQRVVQ